MSIDKLLEELDEYRKRRTLHLWWVRDTERYKDAALQRLRVLEKRQQMVRLVLGALKLFGG